ncbi:coiled-coil domain-containing protein 181-like [Hetaerina americana]|uniref:coiled-coil domain-containing protein 181-like n=1 Tax=Hetaerina americana TaxID=62018 RepID=UPI003A7F415E
MISLSTEELVGHGDTFPLYDISQKVKEANEALKKDVTPPRDDKQFKVKFCPNLVHFEPDVDSFSDTTCEDSTDGTDNVTGGAVNRSNDGLSSDGLHSNLFKLQEKQEGINSSSCNVDTQQSNAYINDNSWKHSIQPDKAVLGLENHKPTLNLSDYHSQTKLGDLNTSSNEISLASFNEVLKDMEFNKTDDENEKFLVHEGMNFHAAKTENTDMHKESLQEKDDEPLDDKREKLKDDDEYFPKQVSTMNSTLTSFDSCKSQACIGELSANENNNDHFLTKRSDKYLCQNEMMTHQNPRSFSPFEYETNRSDLRKYHHKYLMHYKWNTARLPTYNGLNSEYGLTAEMLEERKRKSEMIRQNLWEKKKQEEEMKEQKRKENDESFKEWLRKKEAERKKIAEGKNDFEYVYDRQEAENAFQLWLKRKSKELRQKKKLKNTEREYEKKIAQRRLHEESQREFKRWLREKMKKLAPGKNKGNTFNRRKSFKRHAMEKNIHMKNTCKIYLGH